MPQAENEFDDDLYIIKRANNMRIARLKRGLSQAQMARLTHTTQPTYSRIESGVTFQPDEEIIRRIATVLKIQPRRLREKARVE